MYKTRVVQQVYTLVGAWRLLTVAPAYRSHRVITHAHLIRMFHKASSYPAIGTRDSPRTQDARIGSCHVDPHNGSFTSFTAEIYAYTHGSSRRSVSDGSIGRISSYVYVRVCSGWGRAVHGLELDVQSASPLPQ